MEQTKTMTEMDKPATLATPMNDEDLEEKKKQLDMELNLLHLRFAEGNLTKSDYELLTSRKNEDLTNIDKKIKGNFTENRSDVAEEAHEEVTQINDPIQREFDESSTPQTANEDVLPSEVSRDSPPSNAGINPSEDKLGENQLKSSIKNYPQSETNKSPERKSDVKPNEVKKGLQWSTHNTNAAKSGKRISMKESVSRRMSTVTSRSKSKNKNLLIQPYSEHSFPGLVGKQTTEERFAEQTTGQRFSENEYPESEVVEDKEVDNKSQDEKKEEEEASKGKEEKKGEEEKREGEENKDKEEKREGEENKDKEEKREGEENKDKEEKREGEENKDEEEKKSKDEKTEEEENKDEEDKKSKEEDKKDGSVEKEKTDKEEKIGEEDGKYEEIERKEAEAPKNDGSTNIDDYSQIKDQIELQTSIAPQVAAGATVASYKDEPNLLHGKSDEEKKDKNIKTKRSSEAPNIDGSAIVEEKPLKEDQSELQPSQSYLVAAGATTVKRKEESKSLQSNSKEDKTEENIKRNWPFDKEEILQELRKFTDPSAAMKTIEEQKDAFNKKLYEVQKELQKLEEKYKSPEARRKRLQRRLDEMEFENKRREKRMERIESQMKELDFNQKEKQINDDEYKRRKNALEAEKVAVEGEIKAANQELLRVPVVFKNSQNKQATNKPKDPEAGLVLTKVQLEQQIRQLNREIAEKKEELRQKELEEKVAGGKLYLKEDIENQKKKIEDLDKSIKDVDEEITKLTEIEQKKDELNQRKTSYLNERNNSMQALVETEKLLKEDVGGNDVEVELRKLELLKRALEEELVETNKVLKQIHTPRQTMIFWGVIAAIVIIYLHEYSNNFTVVHN